MDGQNYVIFHNAADDSYMNTTANFRGAYANTETVDIYFKAAAVGDDGSASAGYDKIVVACTNGEEDRAIEQLAAVMAGSRNPVTVIADDVNSVYACSDITSVTSITMSSVGQYQNIISWTADTNLESYHSGSWVVAADATALDLNLPTASGNSGVYYEIFIQKAQTGDTHIMAESGDYFEGGLFIADADTATENIEFHLANTAEDDVINLDSDAKGRLAGGYIKLVCDGTKWHVTGQLNGTGTLATPFHTAES